MWEYQMVPLSQRGLRCIATDRRGHGRSDDPGRGHDFDTFADDLAATIHQLDLRDVTLVGQSMGCGEVARYLSRHGAGRIRSVVLSAPPCRTCPRPRTTRRARPGPSWTRSSRRCSRIARASSPTSPSGTSGWGRPGRVRRWCHRSWCSGASVMSWRARPGRSSTACVPIGRPTSGPTWPRSPMPTWSCTATATTTRRWSCSDGPPRRRSPTASWRSTRAPRAAVPHPRRPPQPRPPGLHRRSEAATAEGGGRPSDLTVAARG
jgi:pimeloyl-ACP methyl ester carboxylesterase